MDEIQVGISQFLEPLGFGRAGRTYNRATDEGIIQVIGLQMGQRPEYAIIIRA